MSADAVTPILPGPPAAASSSTAAAPGDDAAPGEFAALVAGADSAKPAADARTQTQAQPQDAKAAAAETPSEAPGETPAAAPGALTLQLLPETPAAPPTIADAAQPNDKTTQPKLGATKALMPVADLKADASQTALAAPSPKAAPQVDAKDAAPPVTQQTGAQDKPAQKDKSAQPAAQASAAPAQPDPAQTLAQSAATPPQPDAALTAQIVVAAPTQANAQTQPTAKSDDILAAPANKLGAAPAEKPGAPLVDPSGEDKQAPVKTANAGGQHAARASEGKGALPSPAQTQTAAADTSAAPARAADPLASSISAPQSAAPAPASAHGGAQLGPPGLAVAQEIVRRFDGGNTSFQLRLDPPELGRVDIRLDVSRDKKVTATISADNPATLSDLKNSTRELQRALTDSGLDLADNGLSFSDRRDSAPSSFAQSQLRGTSSAAESEIAPAPTPARPLGVQRWGGAGVDVWA